MGCAKLVCPNEDQRLAAILAADVVGYSRLMGQDEAGTLAALEALRTVTEHSGRIFKSTADGCLAEFSRVVEIQRAIMARTPGDHTMQLRIGINLGDVIVEGDDVFSDGVNVAARIENMAAPGDIAISGTVRLPLP